MRSSISKNGLNGPKEKSYIMKVISDATKNDRNVHVFIIKDCIRTARNPLYIAKNKCRYPGNATIT